jgi:hypothetical protein
MRVYDIRGDRGRSEWISLSQCAEPQTARRVAFQGVHFYNRVMPIGQIDTLAAFPPDIAAAARR